jgi:hypothetical protein
MFAVFLRTKLTTMGPKLESEAMREHIGEFQRPVILTMRAKAS